MALAHADAKTTALKQLADLSDEGLGKLKPTARLSPKRKRALVMVSDSSRRLCKTRSLHQVRLGSRSEVGSLYFGMVGSALYYVLGESTCMAAVASGRACEGASGKSPRSHH